MHVQPSLVHRASATLASLLLPVQLKLLPCCKAFAFVVPSPSRHQREVPEPVRGTTRFPRVSLYSCSVLADGWLVGQTDGETHEHMFSASPHPRGCPQPKLCCLLLSSSNPRRWRKVGKCLGIQELACSLMCLEKQDLYNKFKGRVQAVSLHARSPWVESEYLDYLFDGRSVGRGQGGTSFSRNLAKWSCCPSHPSPISPKQKAALWGSPP